MRSGATRAQPARLLQVRERLVERDPPRLRHVGRRTECGQVALSGVQRGLDVAHAPTDQVLRRLVGAAHGDVGFALREVQEAVVDDDLELHRRMQRMEARQQRQQQTLQQRVGGGEPQHAAHRQIAALQAALRGLDVLLYAGQAVGECTPFGGQRVARGQAVEQAQLQMVLERGDAAQDG
jgi:hydrogenase maturation factor